MDVVYPLIKTKNNNLELKYSLRGLNNIDHDKVFIIGYKPNWVCNVEHIPFVDCYRKGLNTVEKIRIACEDNRISNDFVWMMDDVYILNKIDKLEYYAVGKLDERIQMFIRKTQFTESISALLNIFPNGYDYDSHTPIVFNKKKMLKILNKHQGQRGSKRSWYCNHYKIKPANWITIDYKNNMNSNVLDCKCYNINKLQIKKGQNFLSSSDEIIKSALFKKFMDKLYPVASKYEDLSCKYIWMEKVNVYFIKSLFPYKKGENGEMKTERAIMRENKGYVKILDQDQKKMTPVADKSMQHRATENKIVEKEISSIEKLRIKYEEKLGKTVPNNKKNDAQWIQSKIDAL